MQTRVMGRVHDVFQRSGASAERRKHASLQKAALCRVAATILVAGSLALNITTWAQGWQLAKDLKVQADVAVKETYDDNVFLQDTDPVAAGALPAEKTSWVTSFTPRLALDYKPCAYFTAAVSYAPDFVVYHDAHSEDYFAHRFSLTLGGKGGDIAWELGNAFTLIDGNHLGPFFARPQDTPAVGGIPLRDRRDAFVYRGGLKLTWTLGKFFIRPVGSAYIHDFGTEQLLGAAVPPGLFYVNYNDRQDVNGGLDLGYKVADQASLVAGYRYGRQDQYRGPSVFNTAVFADSPYDSAYHRVLVGVEGSPAPWLKLTLLGGPEFRDWTHATPAGFDQDEVLYWIDSAITLLPTKADMVTLKATRYEQPAFTSQSVYEDIRYEVAWKHKFSDKFTAAAGLTLYIGDWQSPVNREDWIYTPSVSASYAFNAHFTAEAAWSHDVARNDVPTTKAGAAWAEGREYTRNLVSLAVKYAF